MSARKSFGWLKWLVFLALLGGGAWGAYYLYGKRTKVQPLDYKTATVSRGDLTQAVTANGQISPVKNVTVGSQVSGIITAIFVDFNSQVTNGQKIAQIDPSTYQQSLTQSEAELANARAGFELAQVNFRRASELRTNELISVSDYDKTLTELHQADAAVQTREAIVKKGRVDVERTTIYAPIDGIVISRSVDVGQTVASSFNTPTLFNIANDLRQMRVEALVSEADVGGVEEGQQVSFTVDAFPSRQFRGKVTQVRYAPVTNQNVVNYISVIEVRNDDLKLRPGMTAYASIITAQRTNAMRIPNAALRFSVPPNAVVIGNTNLAAGGTNSAGGTNRSAQAGGRRGDRPDRPEGMPVAPWTAENRRPTPEERAKWMETLTPEQRQQVEQWRERMRASGGFGGGGGGGGGGGEGGPGGGLGGGASPRATQEGPQTRTVYLVEKPSEAGTPVLRAATIKTGISDSGYTEVVEGLKDGDVLAIGVVQPASSGGAKPTASAGTSSPFGSPFGGFRPR